MEGQTARDRVREECERFKNVLFANEPSATLLKLASSDITNAPEQLQLLDWKLF